MARQPTKALYRYAGFVSYSSADRTHAERFQSALEKTKIPRELRGRDALFGTAGARFPPIFRDRSDLEADPDLAGRLDEALRDAAALIVLCSPASASSKWVNREIALYKAMGRRDRIFAVIVDAPPGAPHSVFPPALTHQAGPDGAVLDALDAEPLAVDVRAQGDGFEGAVRKVAAALLNVPLTELTQRQLEAERRERRRNLLIAQVMTFLAVLATVASVIAVNQTEAANRRLDQAISFAARQIDAAADFRATYGVPDDVIVDMLSSAEKDFDSVAEAEGGHSTRAMMLQRARLQNRFAGLYFGLDDYDDGARLLKSSGDLLEQLAHKPIWADLPIIGDPIDPAAFAEAQLEHARNVADERYLDGDDAGAVSASEQSVALAAARAPSSDAARLDYAEALFALGQTLYDIGGAEKLTQSLEAYSRGLAQAGRVNSDDAKQIVAKGESAVATMLFELGQYSDVMAHQNRAAQLAQEVSDAAPRDAELKAALAVQIARQADYRFAIERDASGAARAEQAAAIFQDVLTRVEPRRVDWRRGRALAQQRVGDFRMRAADSAGALQAYEESRTILADLRDADPDNLDRRRDFSVSLERVGDALIALGRTDEAEASYSACIAERRAILEGDDTEAARRDLAIALKQHARFTNSSDWNAEFEEAAALMGGLVDGAPDMTGWSRDLMIVHFEYGERLERAGMASAARAEFAVAAGIAQALVRADPGNLLFQQDLAQLQQRQRGGAPQSRP